MMHDGPQNIRILQNQDLPHEVDPAQPIYPDSVLYSYRQFRTINGIPVAEAAQNLMVASEQELLTALVCHRTVHTFMHWISPDTPELLQELDAIKQRQADGNIIVKDQSRQYSQSRGAFLVSLTYETLQYELNPRFAYLKQ